MYDRLDRVQLPPVKVDASTLEGACRQALVALLGALTKGVQAAGQHEREGRSVPEIVAGVGGCSQPLSDLLVRAAAVYVDRSQREPGGIDPRATCAIDVVPDDKHPGTFMVRLKIRKPA